MQFARYAFNTLSSPRAMSSMTLREPIATGERLARIAIGSPEQGKCRCNHSFQEGFFGTNARQDANAHQNAEQMPGQNVRGQ